MDCLASVCRVCLQYNQESNSFVDQVEYEGFIKLGEIFQKVTNVEMVEYDDAKPCRLCQDCTERLLNAYEFICWVEKSEVDIDNYLMTDIQESEEDLERFDADTKIDVTSMDIEDVEILDEEFEIDQDQPVIANEVVVDTQDLSADSVVDMFESSTHTVHESESKRCDDTVGSRLSKRLISSNFKCNSCQRSFAKLETLDRHIKMAHTTIPREELASISAQVDSDANDKEITCSYCPQVFKRRNNYVRHLTTSHSKDVEHLSEEDKLLVKTKNNYKRSNCPYCDKDYTQASLVVHIRRHTGENPYQCDECEKAFPRRQDLVVHQRKHTGEKPHLCTLCGKSFSRANKLARHMRVHTGERPYKCTTCQRSFAQSNDLKIHMRRHTGERPYKCSVCMEAFICGAALKTHRRQKNHHSAKDEYDDPFANWRVCKREIKPKNDDKLTDTTNIIQLASEETNYE